MKYHLTVSMKLFGLVLFLLAPLVFSETYYVKPYGDDFTSGTSWQTAFYSITKATNVAKADDLIWVAEGTYKEGDTITIPEGVSVFGGFAGTETSLEERNISGHPTIIDGEESHRCVANYGTIDGFHVINGNAHDIFLWAGYDGGGIYNYGGKVTNCTLYSNLAYYGGGIYNRYGIVTNCFLYSNSAYRGGGIYNEKGTLTDSILYSNSADYDGGGIESDEGIIIDCTLYDNFSLYGGGGISNILGEVTNCILYSNSSSWGGGISNATGTISNCIIYSNSADVGGGIRSTNGTVTNCTLYSNSAEKNYGGGIFCEYHATIMNCISWNNENGDISDISWINPASISFSCYGEACEVNGNIRSKPLFMNTSGDPSSWDFHLLDGSPCIDAGTLENAPDEDIEENPRPGGDGKVCMGAYESPDHYVPSPPQPPTRIYVSKSGNNTNGISWDEAYTSITMALSVVEGDNLYEIWVGEGIYREGRSIFVPVRVNLYGGFAGTETSLEQRNISEHPAIIDGEKSYGCVVNMGTIDGFYITNGHALYGGGIYNNPSARVINCTLYSNSADHSAGGIHNFKGTVMNCTLHSNSAERSSGGIQNSRGTVINCILYSNSSSWGGGIGNDEGTVMNSALYSNSAADSGGGLYNYEGTITNCILYSNSAFNSGGGIHNYEGTITNCILHSNSSINSGGGIYNEFGIIVNSTLYSNSADLGGGIHNYYHGTITNCISWENNKGDIYGYWNDMYFSCYGEAFEGNGNIRCNPLFTNTSGDSSTWDFRLLDGSPCIDSGTTDTARLPDKDMDGNPRPGEDGKVCMGAYESPDFYTPLPPGPRSRIYVSKSGNNNGGGSWEDAYTSITTALSSIGDDLYEIWVEKGIYQEGDTIYIPGRVIMYGGFVGTETFLEERNIADNPTIIDGDHIYRCVYNYSTIDGFHINNGSASLVDNDRGGGIYNYYGKITNCILDSNSARLGGGIFNNSGTIIHCVLNSNSAKLGGGIFNQYGIVTQCTLYSNYSNYLYVGEGGGIYNSWGTVSDCTIHSNWTWDCGGGIYNEDGTVTNCTIHSNHTWGYGGGIYNDDGMIKNSFLYSNDTGYYGKGGGIYNFDSIIYNCIISSNSGWGIYNAEGRESTVYNSTLYNNEYGIYNKDNQGTVVNCISWLNGATDIEGGTISYSCFKEATGINGNINADPLFIKTDGDISSWIFQVKNGSPCIDAGNPDESYNDGCFPPGKGGLRNDMGAYGGPYNCNWGVKIGKSDLIDFLKGRKTLYGFQFPFADRNADDKVDAADLIDLIQSLTSPTP